MVVLVNKGSLLSEDLIKALYRYHLLMTFAYNNIHIHNLLVYVYKVVNNVLHVQCPDTTMCSTELICMIPVFNNYLNIICRMVSIFYLDVAVNKACMHILYT